MEVRLMNRRLFQVGDLVFVSGDIEFDNYNVRVSTNGIVEMEEIEGETQLLVTLDEIDGDRHVTVYVHVENIFDRVI